MENGGGCGPPIIVGLRWVVVIGYVVSVEVVLMVDEKEAELEFSMAYQR